jgi:hypothetical protein
VISETHVHPVNASVKGIVKKPNCLSLAVLVSESQEQESSIWVVKMMSWETALIVQEGPTEVSLALRSFFNEQHSALAKGMGYDCGEFTDVKWKQTKTGIKKVGLEPPITSSDQQKLATPPRAQFEEITLTTPEVVKKEEGIVTVVPKQSVPVDKRFIKPAGQKEGRGEGVDLLTASRCCLDVDSNSVTAVGHPYTFF